MNKPKYHLTITLTKGNPELLKQEFDHVQRCMDSIAGDGYLTAVLGRLFRVAGPYEIAINVQPNIETYGEHIEDITPTVAS